MAFRTIVTASIAAAVVAASAAQVAAQRRPSTLAMSCAGAHDFVMRSGAVVLNTGGHTFDRFVRHRGYCTPHEITRPAFVPTGDNPQCFVGYTCEPYQREFPDYD